MFTKDEILSHRIALQLAYKNNRIDKATYNKALMELNNEEECMNLKNEDIYKKSRLNLIKELLNS